MNKRTEQLNGYEHVEDFPDMYVEHLPDDALSGGSENLLEADPENALDTDRIERSSPEKITEDADDEELPNLSSEPDASDIEYPEEYQQEFSPIFGYVIVEVSGTLEMQNNGQIISSFIAEDDKSSFYSAVQEAHEFGRGVWTYEDTTGSHAAIFVRSEPSEDGSLTYEWHSYVREPLIEEKEILEPEEVREPETIVQQEQDVMTEARIQSTEVPVAAEVSPNLQQPTNSPVVGYSERSEPGQHSYDAAPDEYQAVDASSEIDTAIDTLLEEEYRGDFNDELSEEFAEPSTVHTYEALYAFFEETLQRQVAIRTEAIDPADSYDSRVESVAAYADHAIDAEYAVDSVGSVESQTLTVDTTTPEVAIPEVTQAEVSAIETSSSASSPTSSPDSGITLAEHRETFTEQVIEVADGSAEFVRSLDDESSVAFFSESSGESAQVAEAEKSHGTDESHELHALPVISAETDRTAESLGSTESFIESFDEPIESIALLEHDSRTIEDDVDVQGYQVMAAQVASIPSTAGKSFENASLEQSDFGDHAPEPQPFAPDSHADSFAYQNRRSGIETGISLVVQENRAVTRPEQTVEDFTQFIDFNQDSEKQITAHATEHRSAPERVILDRDSIEQAFAETGIRLVARTRERNESGRAVRPSRTIPIAAQAATSTPATTQLSGTTLSAKAA